MTAAPPTQTRGAAAPPAAKPKSRPTGKTQPAWRTPTARQVRVLDGDVPLTGLFVIMELDPDLPNDPLFSAYRDACSDEQVTRTPLYGLGFVDGDGYLQPVGRAGEPNANPWHAMFPRGALRRLSYRTKAGWVLPAARSNPHAWKLAGEVDVRVLLIRHPSPDRARAVLHALGRPDRVPARRYRLPADLPSWFRTARTRQSGSVLVLDLASFQASDYWPPGPSQYGGWTLYADMPHAHRKEIGDQVRQLREHLGLLLYPFRGGTPYCDSPDTPPEVASAFDGGVLAAVAGFQRDAVAGKAFRLQDADAARGSLKQSFPMVLGKPEPGWWFVLGDVVDAPGLPEASFEEDSRWEPGVVDARTGDALHSWLAAGCARPFRDPGVYRDGVGALRDAILVPLLAYQGGKTSWFEWAAVDLVVRVTLLRFLLMRLGCPYGMSVSHTFREIASPGGAGKALCSIHKSGRAVDFAVVGSVTRSQLLTDYSLPVGAWPIRYEADWFGGKAGEAQAEKVLASARQALAANQRDLAAVETRLTQLNTRTGDHPTQQQQQQQRELETRRDKLVAARPGLEKRVRYAEVDSQRAHDPDDKRKAGHRLRWRIFAHSTWLPPAGIDGYRELASAIGLPVGRKPLDEVDYDTRTALEDDVIGALAASLGNSPAAQRWLDGPRQLVRRVIARVFGCELGAPRRADALEPPDLLDPQFGMFRTSIRPWDYNPFSESGGKPLPPVAATGERAVARHYLDASRIETGAVPEHTRSFVNVTRLAALCGLHRIGPQMALIRDPNAMAHDVDDMPPPLEIAVVEPVVPGRKPEYRNAGALTGLCRKLAASASHAKDQIAIARPDGDPFSVALAELDTAAMTNWVRASKDERSLPHRLNGFAIEVEVPPRFDATAAPATRNDARRRDAASARRQKLVQLFESVPRLVFYVLAGPGELAGLPPDVAREPKTGAQWAEIFAQHGPVPTDRPSTQKQRADWSVTLQPCFLDHRPVRGLAGVPFCPQDVVTLNAPGVGRALEWWHYETAEANRRTWGELLVSMGYDRTAVIAPAVPPAVDQPFALNGRGLGFVTERSATTPDIVRGGARAAEVNGEPVENGS